MNLSEIPVGKGGIISRAEGRLRQRLSDLGFTRGAVVECLFAAPGRGMRAYRVRGAVIALRGKDAQQVMMEGQCHA